MNIRLESYYVLKRIYQDKAFSNLELSAKLRNLECSDADRKLLTKIVYTTISKDITLNYLIKKSETTVTSQNVLILIKLSLVQLLYMDRIPSYAIVNEAVNIAKELISTESSRFVNAILHKFINNKYEVKKEDFKDIDEYYSVYYSTPLFIIKMLSKQYGYDKLIEYLEAYNNEPKLIVRLNTLRNVSKDDLDDNFKVIDETMNCYEYVGGSSLMKHPLFKLGKLVIQDYGSIRIPYFFEDFKEDETILDMCSAPGSKTYELADITHNTCNIISNDINSNRLELVKNNLEFLHVKKVKLINYDATELNKVFPNESFDKILLDAPCSNLGIARRKPDLFLRIKGTDLDEISIVQNKLLLVASELVKVNGQIVYSTCSINKKEDSKLIYDFIASHENFELVKEELLWPNEIHDGFYMALLKKVK